MWSIEKYNEFKKLKRSGYSQEMLIQHFGEDIYESGIYNKKSSVLPYLEYIREIKINPEETNYIVNKRESNIYENSFDYIIEFNSDDSVYCIILFMYIIDDITTYNILLTTKKQWIDYENKLFAYGSKGYVTDSELLELANIVEKETGLNKLYSVIRKASYVLLDTFKNYIKHNIISIGETKNPVKINLYRNIIKNSFNNIDELGEKYDVVGNKYFIYKINR